jgi:hypothetical protein
VRAVYASFALDGRDAADFLSKGYEISLVGVLVL